eukprot:6266773-Pyramimonas_sp.AAC.3
MLAARVAEQARLEQDDRDYTRKHRNYWTGMPMKNSMLDLDPLAAQEYGLVNPTDIMTENKGDRVEAQRPAKDMEFLKAEVRNASLLITRPYNPMSLPPTLFSDPESKTLPPTHPNWLTTQPFKRRPYLAYPLDRIDPSRDGSLPTRIA